MAAPNPPTQQRALPFHHAPHLQGLPSISSLTNGLPPSHHTSDHSASPETARDSGTWPGSQSKRESRPSLPVFSPPPPSFAHINAGAADTSTNSGLQVHTLLNPDESPSRSSVPSTPLSARGPTSAGGSALPSINQGFHDAVNSQRDSRDSIALSLESRRSSVDSRMHVGMNNLYIHGATSPYESTNTSQVSLAASLRRPNGHGTPASRPAARNGSVRSSQPRVAPPIIGRVPGAPDPTAAKPTQGYPWAFPDSVIPEERDGSDSDDSDMGMSRQNSYAASSIRSSIFSNDSHMPPGQRRLEDEHATTHHHSMQHRAIQSLQNEHGGQGVGNYSRTPELRVSHKLAERKRRSEMKGVFEELNKAVPSSGGAKASKWEILTKAIEYIRQSQHTERQLHLEVQRLQRDTNFGRDAQKENEMLKTEVQVMHQHLRRLDPNNPHVYGHYTSQLSQQQQQQQSSHGTHTNGSAVSLPPLQQQIGAAQHVSHTSHPAATAPSGAMQGVEYGGYGR